MARNEHKKVLEELSEAYQKVINEQTDDLEPYGTGDDSDASLWRVQMNKEAADRRKIKEMQRDIMNGMTAKESMERLGVKHPDALKSLLAKYIEWSKDFSEGPIETGFEDEEYDEYNPAYGKVPKRTIRSFRDRPPRTDPSFKGQVTSSEDIDKIDLSKWREYIKAHRGTGVDDIMKAVYRQYGKKGRATLPEVDSFDYGTMWSTKIRPFLMDKFPNS